MNNFSSTLNEMQADNEEISIDVINDIVMSAWDKVLPKSKLVLFKGGLSSSYMIFTGTLGNTKTEYQNGISQNDPLHLSFNVDISKTPLTIEWSNNSLSINPDNKYHAFSSKKLKMRKTKTKSLVDFASKMEKAFIKVREEVKKSLADKEFTVYSADIQKMIKSKV